MAELPQRPVFISSDWSSDRKCGLDARLRRLRKKVRTTAGFNTGVTVALWADTRRRKRLDFREETGRPSLMGQLQTGPEMISQVDLRGPQKLYLD